MKLTLISLTAALGLPSIADAQRLVAYSNAAAKFAEVQVDTPLGPGSTPPALATYPASSPLPPVAGSPRPGDSTFASFAGLNLYTNGVTVTSTPTTSYPPAAPPLAPIVIPAALMATLGGPATGLAYDAITGTLWLASASTVVVGVTPVPGMPIVVPAFTIPFTTGAICGLEYDAMTGLLLAVDVGGVVYPFLASGVAAGPAIVPAVPPPGMPGDVAIDKTGMLNSAGARPIYVSAGAVYYDITLPAPTFYGLGLGAGVVGLAFQPMPAQSLPFGGCPCGGMSPAIGTTGGMVAGNAIFGMTLSGIAPGAAVFFGLDFTFSAAFPLINVGGCGLGLIPGSPTLVPAVVFADPTGTATYPLPLTVLPGFGPIYAQALTLCPADPAGFLVAPMQQIVACGA